MMDGKTESGLMARMCTTGIDSPVPEFIQGPGDASQCTIAIDGAARFAARPWHVIRTVIPTLARALVNSVRHSLSGQAAPGPFRVPRTPFNGKATARRTIAHVQLDLADVKKVKNHFGVKVNDVVMALLSGALRDYLIDLDELPDASLIALVPMAIDDRGQDFGGNQLAAAFCSLESQVADPVERLNAIAQASSMAKNRAVELGPTLIRDTLQYVSPRLMGWAMRLYLKSGLTERRPIHNISVTNVPAAPEQWYLAGARVTAMYGLPPVMYGGGLHAGISSLNGKLEIGLVSCPELVPRLWDIADRIPVGLKELVAAAE